MRNELNVVIIESQFGLAHLREGWRSGDLACKIPYMCEPLEGLLAIFKIFLVPIVQ